MKVRRIELKKIAGFFVISLMLLLFCVMKVMRGADTSSTQIGGIWNYISLLYYPIVLFIVVRQRLFKVRPAFIFLFLYTFIALMTSLVNFNKELTIANLYSILMIPYFALVFVAFYLLSDPHNRMCSNLILITFYLCLIINLYTIIEFQFMGKSRPLASDIYFSLSLFPITLVLLNNKAMKVFAVVGMFLAVFFSGKRTGLIAYSIAFICYYLLKGHIEDKKSFAKRLKTMFVMIFLIVMFYVITLRIDNLYDLGIYDRLFRLADDGGSGRDDIYSTVWKAFLDAPFINKLFGHGVYASENITDARAHNDFLEVLYDYGIFALSCFVGFYLSLLSELKKMIRKGSKYAPAFASSLIIGIFLSMFSFYMTFYTYVTSGVAVMGYIIASENTRIAEMECSS